MKMTIINMDNMAGSHLDEKVIASMEPYFSFHYGNPSSSHDLGIATGKALNEAREKVAGLISADADDIIFTSSATESNNLALKGLAMAGRKKGNHIVTSATEHFSILNPLKTLQKEGFTVTILPVDNYGLIDPIALDKAINDHTILVSIQTANPEIGTIQTIDELAAIAIERGVPFHTDATAAAGWMPIDVKKTKISLLTLAGDQLNGPRGSAALYVKAGHRLQPLLEGGIQERGLRSGTENVPAIVGFGEAAHLAQQSIHERVKKMASVRDNLKESFFSEIPYLHINGHPEKRLPNNLNISVQFVEGEALLMRLNMAGIYVSSGSSCTSQALKASHVLTAIGVPPELAQGSLLFTLGVGNSLEEVPYVTAELSKAAELLRNMSPLYQQFKKGE